ncbi:MAG: sulfite reductase flavoprotein subunit alpha [Planctomycetota bacterium]
MIAPNPTLPDLPAGLANPAAPLVPDDAPFDAGQRQWLNGLLTGLTVLARAANGGAAGASGGTELAAPAVPLSILYGSQSGNCEALSKDLRKAAKAAGFDPKVSELNDVEPAELAALGRVLIVCSTFGEGDPPDNAMKFCERIQADDAPELAGLDFAVCGMGDSSYTHFNKTARDLDARLEQLGATRAADFVACDVDYDDDYAAWKESVFASDALINAAGAASSSDASGDDDEPKEKYTKNEPFAATVLDVRNLNGQGSAKEVNHIEISLAGSGLDYQVGDALGLWPTNCTNLVQHILDAAGLTGREVVTLKAGPMPIRAALLDKLDLCTVTAKTYEVLEIQGQPVPGQHVLDVLETLDPKPAAQQLAEALRPLSPRLYSIASSVNAHPGEVHLTVGAVRYETHGKTRKGVASTFLADRCACGTRVGVYLQRSAHFHIPPDDVPLIMIGPGTGIAPFRAFLEERSTHETPGRNWLFFGDQHEATDFLYRDEIDAWLADGTLERFDAAWSRDQSEKVYVQTKMLEHGADLWSWLDAGAAVYVCGDASRMANDVDAALHTIVAEHGQMSAVDAAAYVEQLKADHRYQRDVY